MGARQHNTTRAAILSSRSNRSLTGRRSIADQSLSHAVKLGLRLDRANGAHASAPREVRV